MLYREIIAVCSQIHTKHTNTMCGQNVELLSVKPGGTYSDHCALHIVTAGLYSFVFHRLTICVRKWEYNIKILLKKVSANNWNGCNCLRSACCQTCIAISCESSDSTLQTTRRHSRGTAVSLDTVLKKNSNSLVSRRQEIRFEIPWILSSTKSDVYVNRVTMLCKGRSSTWVV